MSVFLTFHLFVGGAEAGNLPFVALGGSSYSSYTPTRLKRNTIISSNRDEKLIRENEKNIGIVIS